MGKGAGLPTALRTRVVATPHGGRCCHSRRSRTAGQGGPTGRCQGLRLGGGGLRGGPASWLVHRRRGHPTGWRGRRAVQRRRGRAQHAAARRGGGLTMETAAWAVETGGRGRILSVARRRPPAVGGESSGAPTWRRLQVGGGGDTPPQTAPAPRPRGRRGIPSRRAQPDTPRVGGVREWRGGVAQRRPGAAVAWPQATCGVGAGLRRAARGRCCSLGRGLRPWRSPPVRAGGPDASRQRQHHDVVSIWKACGFSRRSRAVLLAAASGSTTPSQLHRVERAARRESLPPRASSVRDRPTVLLPSRPPPVATHTRSKMH